MKKFKNKKRKILKEIFVMKMLKDKYLTIFIVLALIVSINYLAFSVLLIDNNQANAFNSTNGSLLFNPVGNQTYAAGTNDVLLAEVFLPDASFNANVACSSINITPAVNPCWSIADADGTANAGVGVGIDDDNITSFIDLEPNGFFKNNFLATTDNICTDNIYTPTCIYVDSSCGDGVPTGVIALGGAGCPLGTDVAAPIGLNVPSWIHSEDITVNGAWDIGTDNTTTETLYIMNYVVDTKLAQGSNDNQPTPNQWQGDTPGTWTGLGNAGGEGFIDMNADTVYDGNSAVTPEPAIIDNDGDGYYSTTGDLLLEADGTASVGIGVNDDSIVAGDNYNQLQHTDNICINTFDVGINSNIIVYHDGSDFFDDGFENGTAADCIPGNSGTDTILRDDLGSGLNPGSTSLGTYPYTYFSALGLVFLDNPSSPNGLYDWGTTAANTESIWMELQGSGKYHLSIDSPYDANGTIPGAGTSDDVIATNATLTYLTASDNVCISRNAGIFWAPEDIYVDTTGDCDPSNDVGACTPGPNGCTAHTNLLFDFSFDGLDSSSVYGGAPPGATLGAWASAAGSMAYYDGAVAVNGAYDWGAGAAATETLWIEMWNTGMPGGSYTPKHTSGSDTHLYPFLPTSPNIGDKLLGLSNAFGPSGFPIIYGDTNLNNVLDATDVIYEDNGNMQTGPVTAPVGNGVIDNIGEILSGMVVQNLGSAIPNRDITNVRIYAELWYMSGILGYAPDGRCTGPGGPGDTLIGSMSYDSGTDQWYTNFSYPNSYFLLPRACIVADIPTTAVNNKTFIPAINQVNDVNSDGLFDIGDSGFFGYSTNEGPTDAQILTGDTFTLASSILYPPSYPKSIVDGEAPASPTNVQLMAMADGIIKLTWTDPLDDDLDKIVITEYYNGETMTYTVQKGVEELILTGKEVGGIYKFNVQAQDTTSNKSIDLMFSVTVPVEGEEAGDETLDPFKEYTGSGWKLDGVSVGDLVRSSSDSTVYHISDDGRRYVFPTVEVYLSWYPDFSMVNIVSDDILSQMPLAANVTLRPGTWLMKLQTDPKVYAIEPGGVLRWVTTEDLASGLYGENWNEMILDIPDTFFMDYVRGDDITSFVHPTGTLVQYMSESNVYYMYTGIKKLVETEEVFKGNMFRDEFVIKEVDKSTFDYLSGSNLPKLHIDTLMGIL